MTDTATTSPLIKVARDLTEIERLYEHLLIQAIHNAGSRLMPGGEAMVALGNVGSPDLWAENIAAAEHRHLATCDKLDHTRCRFAEHVADEDEHEPPLQTLLFWSERWRAEAGYELERPTMRTEANFLRGRLDWAWDNEQAFDEFARDVNRARVRLENILHAGKRPERSRIICDKCDAAPRLLVFRGIADDGSDDTWKCPACKTRYTPDDASRAHTAMLKSDKAHRWVPQADAIATLKAQGRAEQLVRRWLADGHGSGYCDPTNHQVWVWWPELWEKHTSTPTRKRAS